MFYTIEERETDVCRETQKLQKVARGELRGSGANTQKCPKGDGIAKKGFQRIKYAICVLDFFFFTIVALLTLLSLPVKSLHCFLMICVDKFFRNSIIENKRSKSCFRL